MPWANIVLYFQMPAWVKTFDQIEVDESDTEEIKCFKVSFFNLVSNSFFHFTNDCITFLAVLDKRR